MLGLLEGQVAIKFRRRSRAGKLCGGVHGVRTPVLVRVAGLGNEEAGRLGLDDVGDRREWCATVIFLSEADPVTV